MTPFTAADRIQLRERGIPLEEAERQLRLLTEPRRALLLERPCRLGDGILSLEDAELRRLGRVFDRARLAGRAAKFVPASGAATRMFGALERAARGEPDGEADAVLADLAKLPFYDTLRDRLGRAKEDRRGLAKLLVETFAGVPKALIPFHRAKGGARTPLEEHLIEAGRYVKDGRGRCRVEFTTSTDQSARFRSFLRLVKPAYEKKLRARLLVSLSAQKPSTDTLSVDASGRPFRLEDGRLLLRPGGHGALIENLSSAPAEFVFIKNVDNVAPDRLARDGARWKRALGGLLVELHEGSHERLSELELGRSGSVERGFAFAREKLGLEPPAGAEPRSWLLDRLDRPLRVCGVVPNTGEPGGGPFWVRSASGELTRQIVESAEAAPGQRSLFAASTHFNPVDLACALRDRKGRRRDLAKYVDPNAVFVSKKSREGRALSALERPGLWNGAMSGWNTVFVEVPGATFSPVKTLLDLLRPEHQP